MRLVFVKLVAGIPSRDADFRRQASIHPPKLTRSARCHLRSERESSFTAANFSGLDLYSASNLSNNEANPGRGVASAKIASQPSVGKTSAQRTGMSRTSCRCDFLGSRAIACSISNNDFMTQIMSVERNGCQPWLRRFRFRHDVEFAWGWLKAGRRRDRLAMIVLRGRRVRQNRIQAHAGLQLEWWDERGSCRRGRRGCHRGRRRRSSGRWSGRGHRRGRRGGSGHRWSGRRSCDGSCY